MKTTAIDKKNLNLNVDNHNFTDVIVRFLIFLIYFQDKYNDYWFSSKLSVWAIQSVRVSKYEDKWKENY